MKYRMLSDEELAVLEDDLKQFLIVNGIDGDEWLKLNKENPKKAIEMVGLFSDTVLQKVYEKLKFVEHRTKDACMVFYLKKDEIELISLNSKGSENIDLSTPELIHNALTKHANELTIFKTKKQYSDQREMEIHNLISNGCVNSSEAFWILLEKVL